MAGYGVTYSGGKQPKGYGVAGSRNLASMYGNTSMQPTRPNGAGFAALNQPAPMDALGRVMANGQNVFQSIAPATAYGMLNTGTTLPARPAMTSDPAKTYSQPDTSSPGSGSGSSSGTTDLSADPILNQIKAIGQRDTQDAYAGGLAGAKNDLINFGGAQVPQSLRDLFAAQTQASDPILGDLPGNPVLAALNDALTAQAASGNPFSVTKQLGQAHESNQHNIDNTSNLANLYYSSTHANQLGDENNAYLGSQNSALQALAQALSGENTGLLSAVNHAHDQYVDELPNAYQRALAAGGSGASGGSGDPTAPPDQTPPPNNSGANFGANPFNPLLAALAGYAPSGPASRLNRYAG